MLVKERQISAGGEIVITAESFMAKHGKLLFGLAAAEYAKMVDDGPPRGLLARMRGKSSMDLDRYWHRYDVLMDCLLTLESLVEKE